MPNTRDIFIMILYNASLRLLIWQWRISIPVRLSISLVISFLDLKYMLFNHTRYEYRIWKGLIGRKRTDPAPSTRLGLYAPTAWRLLARAACFSKVGSG